MTFIQHFQLLPGFAHIKVINGANKNLGQWRPIVELFHHRSLARFAWLLEALKGVVCISEAFFVRMFFHIFFCCCLVDIRFVCMVHLSWSTFSMIFCLHFRSGNSVSTLRWEVSNGMHTKMDICKKTKRRGDFYTSFGEGNWNFQTSCNTLHRPQAIPQSHASHSVIPFWSPGGHGNGLRDCVWALVSWFITFQLIVASTFQRRVTRIQRMSQLLENSPWILSFNDFVG